MPVGFNPYLGGDAVYFCLVLKNISILLYPNLMYIYFDGYIKMEFVLAFSGYKSYTCLS